MIHVAENNLARHGISLSDNRCSFPFLRALSLHHHIRYALDRRSLVPPDRSARYDMSERETVIYASFVHLFVNLVRITL